MNKRIVVCVVIGVLSLFGRMASAQDLGCEAEVSLDGGVIEVSSSSSGDDTDNIQCALDAAADGGYKDVYLTSSAYAVSESKLQTFGETSEASHLHPLQSP